MDRLLLDVLTLEPPHLASAGGPIAESIGEVALVVAGQADKLITDVIVFIIPGLTISPEVTLIPGPREAVLPAIPAKYGNL